MEPKCAKSVKYIKHWPRYGHPKKYIPIGIHCILRLVQNITNRSKNTVISYWNVFLWMTISQPMLDIFNWLCTNKHYFWRPFTKMTSKFRNSKNRFLMTSHLGTLFCIHKGNKDVAYNQSWRFCCFQKIPYFSDQMSEYFSKFNMERWKTRKQFVFC